ncbi:MAG: universal stress protein, partial [Gemmatimonadota bacterium]
LQQEVPERPVQVSLPKERPVRAIRREARRSAADVVVVGSPARSGPRAWLFGNVAEALVGRVPGSVLSVPPAPEEDFRPRPATAARAYPRALEAHGGYP